MSDKLISVIIPIYNRESYLDRCIGSVLAQSNVTTRIILVDDGSTDSSGRICDSYAERYPNIVAIHTDNHGVSHARNTGLDCARGEFLFFLDSDDSIEPDCLFHMLNELEKTGADYCIGKVCEYSDDGVLTRTTDFSDDARDRAVDVRTAFKFCEDMSYPIIDIITGKLYPSGIFEKLRFPEGIYSEDTYILPEIHRQVRSICFSDKSIYNLTLSPVSIMRSAAPQRLIDTCNAHCHFLHYLTESSYYDSALHRFGMGSRDLLTITEALDNSYREQIKKSYQSYRLEAKALIPHVDIKNKLRLILFRISLPIYGRIQKRHSQHLGY